VPQLFSPVFSPEMIRSLLVLSGAKALIFDPGAFPNIPAESVIPTVPAPGADELQELVDNYEGYLGLKEQDLLPVGERQTAVIFHSSGTTCGMPKLIPTSHLSMKTFILHKFPDCLLDEEYKVSSNIFNRYCSTDEPISCAC
jgi:acyl-coenzyme A synthetase/AMP-(fatty) acid ligase